jgi:putative alpha-1,2-mannosidase
MQARKIMWSFDVRTALLLNRRQTVKCVALIALLAGVEATFSVGASNRTPTVPVDWVNTFIGTGGGGVDYGGTMPFVTTPFGMTNWTAQTRQNRISVSSYAYEDSYIQGFIGTHQPAIWMGDYGYVTLMPEIGSINYAPEARRLSFTHKDEVSTPYYYSVKMGSDRHRSCGIFTFYLSARFQGQCPHRGNAARHPGFRQNRCRQE